MSRRKHHSSLPTTPPPAAASRPVRPPRLSLHPDAGGRIPGGVYLTPVEVADRYGPARTLGAPDDARIAMDAQLEADGVYTLLQHTLQLGQGAAPQFMGYGALQNIAQNGLVRACIETVADDMARAWISLKGGEKPDAGGDDERLKTLNDAQQRYGLRRFSTKRRNWWAMRAAR